MCLSREAGTILSCGIMTFFGLFMTYSYAGEQEKHNAIPWGAMYVPLESMKEMGRTGTVGYYRGAEGVRKLLADLKTARRDQIKLIVTMGEVKPSAYADERGRIDMAKVKVELAPFVAVSGQLKPFIEDGTIWGIRFMDEPHDPSGLPRGIAIDTGDLGVVMAYLKESFGNVRVGSTSPARYMTHVPNADWCFGQYCHHTAGSRGIEPIPYIREDAALAKKKGMDYVASLNASTNPVSNREFFNVFKDLAALPDVDFLTSWQWPRGHYRNSFEVRVSDPAVKDVLKEISRACVRERQEAGKRQ